MYIYEIVLHRTLLQFYTEWEIKTRRNGYSKGEISIILFILKRVRERLIPHSSHVPKPMRTL